MLLIHRLVYLLYVVEDMDLLRLHSENSYAVGRVIFDCLNVRESVLL